MNNKVNIRQANINDLNQLLVWGKKLHEVEKEFEPLLTYSEDEARKKYSSQIHNPDCLFLVVELNNAPTGYLYAYLHLNPEMSTDKMECHLEVIYLEKTTRGQNISTLLINKCIEWTKQKNVFKISADIFQQNTSSIKVFEKNGFTKTSGVYSKDI